MNKVVSALMVAFTGAAAASLLMTWFRDQRETKALAKEDLNRWEDDGGSVPARGVAPPIP